MGCGPSDHIQLHEEMMLRCFFFSLCTILYLEYVLIFRLIARKDLKDFTM